MMNCIFRRFIKSPDQHLVQGSEIVCGGPVHEELVNP